MTFPQVNNPAWKPTDMTSATVNFEFDGDNATVGGGSVITALTDLGPNHYSPTVHGSPTQVPAINGRKGIRLVSASSQFFSFATGVQMLDANTPCLIALAGNLVQADLGNFPTALFLASSGSTSTCFLFTNGVSGTYPNLLIGGSPGIGQPGVGADCLNGWDQYYETIAIYNGGGNLIDPANWRIINRGQEVSPVSISFGVSNTNTAENCIGAFGAGGGVFYDGIIANVLMATGPISEPDLLNLQTYLRRKYNAAGNGIWTPTIEQTVNWSFRTDQMIAGTGLEIAKWPEQSNKIDPDTPLLPARRIIDFDFNPFGGAPPTRPQVVANWLNGKPGLRFFTDCSGYIGGPSTIPGQEGPAHWSSFKGDKPFQILEVGEFDPIADGDFVNPLQLSADPTTEDGCIFQVANNVPDSPEFLIITSFGNAVKVDNYYSTGKYTAKHALLVEYNGNGVADPDNWKITYMDQSGTQELLVEATTISVATTNLNKLSTGAGSPNNASGIRGEADEWFGRELTSQTRQFRKDYVKSYWGLG